MDMEEYRDLELTLRVFEKLLDRPELKNYRAGIVLQAYLPDGPTAMARLREFAERRVAEGGAPVKVRLVKGAYLESKSVAFPKKADVDRAFVEQSKILLERGNYPAIATHDEKIIDVPRDATSRGSESLKLAGSTSVGLGHNSLDALQRVGDGMRACRPLASHGLLTSL